MIFLDYPTHDCAPTWDLRDYCFNTNYRQTRKERDTTGVLMFICMSNRVDKICLLVLYFIML
jgi:hypothetical protein